MHRALLHPHVRVYDVKERKENGKYKDQIPEDFVLPYFNPEWSMEWRGVPWEEDVARWTPNFSYPADPGADVVEKLVQAQDPLNTQGRDSADQVAVLLDPGSVPRAGGGGSGIGKQGFRPNSPTGGAIRR